MNLVSDYGHVIFINLEIDKNSADLNLGLTILPHEEVDSNIFFVNYSF